MQKLLLLLCIAMAATAFASDAKRVVGIVRGTVLVALKKITFIFVKTQCIRHIFLFLFTTVHRSHAAAADPASVAYAAKLKSDLQGLEAMRTRVRGLLSKTGHVAEKLTHAHATVQQFSAAIDQTLMKISEAERRETDALHAAQRRFIDEQNRLADLDQRDQIALQNQLELLHAARRPVVHPVVVRMII